MQKILSRLAPLAFVLAILGVLLLSCSTVEHVSAARFLELTEEIPNANTVRDISYIGSTGGRAYLQHWHAQVLFESEISVYWTSLSDLPPALAEELRSGANPWRE